MIKAQNVVKWFGPKLAVDDVSFAVERGEVLGFLGPNGAGKSTTMRMLTGFLPPSQGRIEIGGHDIEQQSLAAKALLGYLPENAPGYPEMTVRGFLNFAAAIRGLRGQEKKSAVDRAIQMCFLEGVQHQSIETLSKGYRHRTCFAQSILHDPPILILDEPTDGLDPNQKHEVRKLIKQMGQHKAIIVSTHILEEVDAICSRVIIIDRGKLVFNGTPTELRRQSDQAGVVTLRVRDTKGAALKQLLGAEPAVKAVTIVDERDDWTLARVHPKQTDAGQPSGILAKTVAVCLGKAGLVADELHTEEGRLDEVFRAITLPDTVTIEEDLK